MSLQRKETVAGITVYGEPSKWDGALDLARARRILDGQAVAPEPGDPLGRSEFAA